MSKPKKSFKNIACLCCAFAVGFFTTSQVYAYQVSWSQGFDTLPYSYRLHTDFNSSEESAMEDAGTAWSSAGVGELAKMSNYSTTESTYPDKDGYNNLTELDDPPNDYLAQCTSFGYTSGLITEADININPHDPISDSPNSNEYDLESIITHEIGHALGLGHSSDRNAVMYESFGRQEVRTVNSDDEDGINAIYN